jgi:putative peptidoglycan lipid II flippase
VDEHPAARGRRLAWSTAIFALATGLSRILGLVREIVASYYFGAAGKINAFTVAFQVPNLVRSLVADAALSSAFVPVFSELLEKGEKKRAWRVASTLFWLMLLGLGALVALLIVIAPLVIAPFGDPGGDKELAIGLSRVLFPIVALLGVSGVIVGILNSYDQFTVPALSPVFWNLAIILGLVLGVPHADTIDAKLYVYAISIVIGTVIQVLLPVPWLLKLDGRLHMVLDWRDPAVRRVFVLMVPVTTPKSWASAACGVRKRRRSTVTRVCSARLSAGGCPPAGLRVGGPPRPMSISRSRSSIASEAPAGFCVR